MRAQRPLLPLPAEAGFSVRSVRYMPGDSAALVAPAVQAVRPVASEIVVLAHTALLVLSGLLVLYQCPAAASADPLARALIAGRMTFR